MLHFGHFHSIQCYCALLLVVAGLREEPVYSLEDVLSCLDSGISLRHTASTQMNEYSSRSHCIFTILIGM